MRKIDLPHGYEVEVGYSSSNLPPGEKGMQVGVGKWIELSRKVINDSGDTTGWHPIVNFKEESRIKILFSACTNEWESFKIFEAITGKRIHYDARNWTIDVVD